MVWMFEEPAVVHELMDFCTTVLIEWVRTQKMRAGAPMVGGAFPHFTPLPPETGGVWISPRRTMKTFSPEASDT